MMHYLLAGALLFVLLAAIIAPLEALGWWAGWFGGKDESEGDEASTTGEDGRDAGTEEAEHYLVYLSGIGTIAGQSVFSEETRFVSTLRANLPATVVVDDIYPYSVSNVGLTGERVFAGVWRWIERQRLKSERTLLIGLVNIRNIMQIGVSADARYGPIYNLGVAQAIWRLLRRDGYRAGSGTPITLIGWSGGGQIAVGAAPYLERLSGTRIRIISIAGMISADPGVMSVEHLYLMQGTKDPIPALGVALYPGRWPIMAHSSWNRARAAGKISKVSLGPYTHIGKGDYFDTTSHLPDGQSYADHTLTTMIDILTEAGAVKTRAPFVSVPAE
jgi:hypothetical protein